MKKANASAKKEEQAKDSPYMKALSQSIIVNNFQTNSQFSRDLGIELLKGGFAKEHFDVLKKSLSGVKEFINLIEEKIAEQNK